MCFNKLHMNQNEEQLLLSSLSIEVDTIFLNLRKADQIIRHELGLLHQDKFELLTSYVIPPINQERLKKIIYKIPPHHLLADEYIVYMLDNKMNSIFKLIQEYNEYLAQRKRAQEERDYLELSSIDGQLSYYTRRLGAMIHHLNIHLNLIHVLLMNASVVTDTQQILV